MNKKRFGDYLRNFIFGVEDGLVSTVGLLSGIAIAAVPKATIILTGIVLIFVEAFSMGVGTLLSEHTAKEFMKKKELTLKGSFSNSGVMFFSYFIAGFIPLAPYLFFDTIIALKLSVAASLLALFILGATSARLFKINMVKKGLEMLIIGGIAIAIGVIVGRFVQIA